MGRGPQTGNTHFYDSDESALRQRWHVSMPSNGQHSFLLLILAVAFAGRGWCQCPPTGNTHFYSEEMEAYIRDVACQCPQTGNTHFYRLGRNILIAMLVLCQCPQTGNTHFYACRRNRRRRGSGCVNALQRATLISISPREERRSL